jgi:peptidoglycan/LPS O-acetylase OafA/YrhL
MGVVLAGMPANSLTLAAVLLASGLSFHWIELPAQRRLRGLLQPSGAGVGGLPSR